MMKRLVLILAAMALILVTAATADAAPKPDDKNHPLFPQECTGGPVGDVVGFTVLANGRAVGIGTLPTGFLYETETSDPIVGVSMYRVTTELDGSFVPTGVEYGQGRSSGNQHKALDRGQDIVDAIERVEAKWATNVCTVTIPGFLLSQFYPDAQPPYVDTYFYTFTNWVK